MDKETLKRYRLIFPGIIMMLFIFPGLTETKDQLMNISLLLSSLKLSDLYYLAIVIILGAIYYTLNVRWFIWKYFNNTITDNIKDTILNECTLTLNSKQWYQLKKGNALMIIFYEFIDNNESLKDKAQDVRFNGLIWTTCFDFTILSSLSGFVYSILSLITTRNHFVYISVVSFWIFYIALVFSSMLTYRHLALSNDQLEVIKQKYKSDINDKVKKVIENL